MSYLCIGAVSHLLSWFCPEGQSQEPLIDKKAVVHAQETMKIVVPDRPLAFGSVQIEPILDSIRFKDLTHDHLVESYALLQTIVRCWRDAGITDYFLYSKFPDDQSPFACEAVPYPKNGSLFWKQFKVWWNVTFEGSKISDTKKAQIVRDFQSKEIYSDSQIEENENETGNDVFCKNGVIEKQGVYEGEQINVLFDHAPLGEWHLLLVPKAHRRDFGDLRKSEYVEILATAQQIASLFSKAGYPLSYLFSNNGRTQSVKHCHFHLVILASEKQECMGKFQELKKIIIGSSRLSDDKLQERVEASKEKLSQLEIDYPENAKYPDDEYIG